MSNIRCTIFFLVIFLKCSSTFANHSYGGMDICALYPEIMPPDLTIELLPEPDSRGAALMQNYCEQCHGLPDPNAHTVQEWLSVLKKMNTLMDVANRFGSLMGAIQTPTFSERKQLQQYLSRHAVKDIQPQHLAGNFAGTVFIGSVIHNGQKSFNQGMTLHWQSWIALGPFLVLIIMGLIKWFYSMRVR